MGKPDSQPGGGFWLGTPPADDLHYDPPAAPSVVPEVQRNSTPRQNPDTHGGGFWLGTPPPAYSASSPDGVTEEVDKPAYTQDQILKWIEQYEQFTGPIFLKQLTPLNGLRTRFGLPTTTPEEIAIGRANSIIRLNEQRQARNNGS